MVTPFNGYLYFLQIILFNLGLVLKISHSPELAGILSFDPIDFYLVNTRAFSALRCFPIAKQLQTPFPKDLLPCHVSTIIENIRV